ncbi:MAG TPA: cytochrome c peroxidase [Rhodocyclaceae bacterium]|nr:cytochrome c peroxidase [Rhodocyclaceae bacterium]
METGLTDVLGIGAVAIVLGLAVLGTMVYRELGPFGGLEAGKRWLLMAAFGMGIFAFGLKMAVAVAVDRIPEHTVRPLVAAHTAPSIAVREEADAGQEAAIAPDHYAWEALPMEAPAPADNPTTPEKVALGKRLFFDQRLSADGTVACASCHNLERKGGADGRRTALGIDGKTGTRNAPTVWNAAFQGVLFWDGRAASLEEQAKGPILNPLEMGMASAAEAVGRVAADAAYRDAFARVFGAGEAITLERIAAAIAAYERTLITPDSPYDRFVRGERAALTPTQQRGMALFESVGCVNCHKGPNFSDASLLASPSPWRLFPANPNPYEQRFDLTADSGAGAKGKRPGMWRIPSLRNVALTGPYFHNGSVDKLADAVRVMAASQLGVTIVENGDNAVPESVVVWSPPQRQIVQVQKRILRARDIDDIVSFLEALSSDTLTRGKPQS